MRSKSLNILFILTMFC